MACNIWEETGLLYGSGELNEQERQAFVEHMRQCSECADEWETYSRERKRFFTIDILGDSPSAACDAEILRVCSSGLRHSTMFRLFPLFLKKSAISLALFLIGFIAVGYIAFRKDLYDQQKTESITAARDRNPAQPSSAAAEEQVNEPSDSAFDSSYEKSVNFANRRGNLELKGVYPVDLQKK